MHTTKRTETGSDMGHMNISAARPARTIARGVPGPNLTKSIGVLAD